MPRNPTTSPAELWVGSAQVDPPLAAVGSHHPVLLLEGSAGSDRVLHRLPQAIPIVRVRAVDVGVERAGEVQGVDAVDPVQLVAPLHGPGPDVPEPTAHMDLRLAAPEPGLDLRQGRLGQPHLGDVLRDGDRPDDAAVLVASGRTDSETGTVMPSLRWTSVSRWSTVSPLNTLVHLGDLGSEVVGEQRRDRLADDLGLEVADDALRAAVARRDPALPVVGQSASLDASAKASRMARRSLDRAASSLVLVVLIRPPDPAPGTVPQRGSVASRAARGACSR